MLRCQSQWWCHKRYLPHRHLAYPAAILPQSASGRTYCSVYEPLCLHQHWATFSVQDERRLNGGAGREAGGSIISDVEPWIRACQGYGSVYGLAQCEGLASPQLFKNLWRVVQHHSVRDDLVSHPWLELCREGVARATSRRVSRLGARGVSDWRSGHLPALVLHGLTGQASEKKLSVSRNSCIVLRYYYHLSLRFSFSMPYIATVTRRTSQTWCGREREHGSPRE